MVFSCYCLAAWRGNYLARLGGRHSQGIPGTFPSCLSHLRLSVLPNNLNALFGRLDNVRRILCVRIGPQFSTLKRQQESIAYVISARGRESR